MHNEQTRGRTAMQRLLYRLLAPVALLLLVLMELLLLPFLFAFLMVAFVVRVASHTTLAVRAFEQGGPLSGKRSTPK